MPRRVRRFERVVLPRGHFGRRVRLDRLPAPPFALRCVVSTAGGRARGAATRAPNRGTLGGAWLPTLLACPTAPPRRAAEQRQVRRWPSWGGGRRPRGGRWVFAAQATRRSLLRPLFPSLSPLVGMWRVAGGRVGRGGGDRHRMAGAERGARGAGGGGNRRADSRRATPRCPHATAAAGMATATGLALHA